MSLPFDYERCLNEDCPVNRFCQRSPRNNPYDNEAHRISLSKFKPTKDGCEHLITQMPERLEEIQQKLRDVHGSD